MAVFDNSDDVSYKTDDFGRPDDKDYHYRIPLNDDRAMRLATWALHEMVHYRDRFVTSARYEYRFWDAAWNEERCTVGRTTTCGHSTST